MKTESLLQYLHGYLALEGHPDYSVALNGLQVEGPPEVARIVAAVDASEASIEAAVELGADLMIVHHGLFWDGLRPLTGRRFRRVQRLISGGTALYACHLPLDSHAEVGNCAQLGRALGLTLKERFGDYKGQPIGWWGTPSEPISAKDLQGAAQDALGGPVRLIEGGPDRLDEASELGLDALVTGEGAHHSYFDAVEFGVHLLLGGHYATETFGVRALAAHIEERFGIPWDFVDQPTGL